METRLADKPKLLEPRFDTIPQELKNRPHWIVWSREERDGKPTKVPYSAEGRYAKANDPLTWLHFYKARELYEPGGFDGIGFVLSVDDPFTGVDLDKCRDPETGAITPEAWQIVEGFNSFTQVTPTGTGLRIWIRGKLPDHTKHVANPRGMKKLEVYDRQRYFTVTGQHVEGAPTKIEERQAELEAFMQEVLGPDWASARTASPIPAWEPEELTPEDEQAIQERRDRDERFDRLWRGDTSGYDGDDSRADQAFCNTLRNVLGPNPGKIDAAFRKSGLMREKWERFDYRQRTIGTALENETDEPFIVDDSPKPGAETETNGPDDEEVAAGTETQHANAENGGRGASVEAEARGSASEATGANPHAAKRFVRRDLAVSLYGSRTTGGLAYDVVTEQVVILKQPVWIGGSRLLGEFVELTQRIAPGVVEDWPVMAFLAGMSILVPQIWVEDLRLNLWFLGIARLSAGKTRTLRAVSAVMEAAGQALILVGGGTQGFRGIRNVVSPEEVTRMSVLQTGGSPEGLLAAASDGRCFPAMISRLAKVWRRSWNRIRATTIITRWLSVKRDLRWEGGIRPPLGTCGYSAHGRKEKMSAVSEIAD
jgi:putative DNA primase/helicase